MEPTVIYEVNIGFEGEQERRRWFFTDLNDSWRKYAELKAENEAAEKKGGIAYCWSVPEHVKHFINGVRGKNALVDWLNRNIF